MRRGRCREFPSVLVGRYEERHPASKNTRHSKFLFNRTNGRRNPRGNWLTQKGRTQDFILGVQIFGSRPSDHYFRSVCLFVCLSVCLCRVFLSRLRSDLDQTRTHVTCPGLVVSPRIWGLCDPWGLGDPQKLVFLGVWGRP